MKKVVNLTKAIGVFALLLLSQAMFAQSNQTMTQGPRTLTYNYVSPEASITRVETKLYQLLGTIKQNQANPNSIAYTDALLRDEYYRVLLVYLQEGNSAQEATHATARKLYGINPNLNLTTLNAINQEALLLLRV